MLNSNLLRLKLTLAFFAGSPPSRQTWLSYEVVRQLRENVGAVRNPSVYEPLLWCNLSNCLLQASVLVIRNYFWVP